MAVRAPDVLVRVKVKKPETLRIAISKSGYAQWRLAQIVQVRPDTLSQITSGRVGCSPVTAKRIAELVEVDVNDLFKLDFELAPSDPAAKIVAQIASAKTQITSAACVGAA